MKTLLFNIGELYTCDRQDRVLRDAWVVVEDGRIEALGSGPLEGDFEQRIDLKGQLVMPGLINLHHHFFQTLTRAIPLALSGHLIDWLKAMYPIWAGITPDDLAVAARATMAELMLTGATTSVDHSYLMPGGDPAYMDALVGAGHEAGMRLHVVSGSMTSMESTLEAELSQQLGPRAGGLVMDSRQVLAEMQGALARHHQSGWGARTSVALGPTTFDYRDLPFMRRISALADEAGVGLHLHFHPRPDERLLCAELSGKSPTAVLEEAGWLRPGTWFAHSTRMDADDMRRSAAHGVGVAHCPRMILRLGARTTPVHDMLAAGMPVGFGVDGGASNDAGSMLGEVRLGLLLHRTAGGEGNVSWEKWISPYEGLLMATRGAAGILRRDDIGQIATGFCADIVSFDMQSIEYAGARTDWLSGLMLAGSSSRCDFSMIGGKVGVQDGQLAWADEAGIGRAVDRATERLILAASSLTRQDYNPVTKLSVKLPFLR